MQCPVVGRSEDEPVGGVDLKPLDHFRRTCFDALGPRVPPGGAELL